MIKLLVYLFIWEKNINKKTPRKQETRKRLIRLEHRVDAQISVWGETESKLGYKREGERVEAKTLIVGEGWVEVVVMLGVKTVSNLLIYKGYFVNRNSSA